MSYAPYNVMPCQVSASEAAGGVAGAGSRVWTWLRPAVWVAFMLAHSVPAVLKPVAVNFTGISENLYTPTAAVFSWRAWLSLLFATAPSGGSGTTSDTLDGGSARMRGGAKIRTTARRTRGVERRILDGIRR